jgi:tetratricopeptide (TPR) repeat protein
VNLRGAEAQALDPADVLAGFLRALGVEGAAIAEGLEERVQQFRTRLADRRVLVVLDNAADEAQVRPLLPASQGCAALVTSRTQLSGLEAAHPLCLDVLVPDQAVQLLAKLAGSGRVAAEPQAAAAIVRLCGWLPLAVRIAGARLASRPQWRLALLNERLADEHGRLDELATGDLEVRASVALSYFGRGEVERRLFRLLGLLAPPSIPAWVAAALLDTGPMEAEGLLERLVDAQLVEAAGQDQTGQLRYRLHDLVRVYARERLALEEPEPAQQASLQRAVQAYLTLAERADALLVPSGLYRYSGDPAARPAAEHPAAAIVERDPSGWFEVERASLVAAVEHGCETGKGDLGWRLADTLTGFFQLHTHWDDWQQTHTLALAAARRAGDRDAEGCVLGGLGELHKSLAAFRETGNRRRELQCLLNLGFIDHEQGRFDDAIARLGPCLVGFRELGARSWEAMALFCLGKVHLDQGRLDAAMACLDQSLTLVRAVADRSWEAAILRRLGLVRSAQGWPEAAVACLEQSLRLVRASGERPGEAYVLQSLGEVYRKQGRLDAATRSIQDSLALARVTGDRSAEAFALHTRDLELRHWEARVLNSLGLLLDAKGDPAAARSAWQAALAMFRQLDMPEAANVASRLEDQGLT